MRGDPSLRSGHVPVGEPIMDRPKGRIFAFPDKNYLVSMCARYNGEHFYSAAKASYKETLEGTKTAIIRMNTYLLAASYVGTFVKLAYLDEVYREMQADEMVRADYLDERFVTSLKHAGRLIKDGVNPLSFEEAMQNSVGPIF